MKKPLALFKKNSKQFLFSTYWRHTALVTLLCGCLSSVVSAQVTKQWDKTYGGSEKEALSKMIPTADGGYLLGGTSSSGISGSKSQPSRGKEDYWVVKINKDGTKAWDKTFGGNDSDYLVSLIATPDNGYLLGGYSASHISGDKTQVNGEYGSYWIVKLDSEGSKIWDKTFTGGNSEILQAIVATPDGGYLLGGRSFSGPYGDRTVELIGESDLWFVKIDRNGNKIWDKNLSFAFGIIENWDIDVANIKTILKTADGGYLVGINAGGFGSIGYNNQDASSYFTVVKLDENGNRIWGKYFMNGYQRVDELQAMIPTANGNYLLGGYTYEWFYTDDPTNSEPEYIEHTTNDYYVLEIDGDGIKLRDKTLGGNENDYLTSLVATTDGGYLLGGYSDSGISGDKSEAKQGLSDYWVVKTDESFTKKWDKTLGGTGSESIISLIETSEKNYLIGGTSSSGISGDKSDVSQGSTDYWLLKIKEEAVPPVSSSWNYRYGGSGVDRFTVVIRTEDGGYLSGGYSNSEASGDKNQYSRGGADYWIVKTDKNGSKQWDKRYGGYSHDYLNRIIQTQDGGYLLAGSSTSGKGGDKSEGRRGDQDYWIVKISSNGTKQWDKTYGGSGFDDLRKVNQLSNGDYLLAGQSNSPISGDKSQSSQGGMDYWIVRVTSIGTKLWDKRYGGSGEEYLESFTKASGGGFLLAGSSASGKSGDKSQASKGGKDYWLVRINSQGKQQWDKSYGGSKDDELYSIGITPTGEYFMAGHSSSGQNGDKSQPNKGSSDYWMLKIDKNGAKLWDKTFGGSGTETLRSIIQVQGGYVLAGSSNSNSSGDKTQASQGSMDYWLVKTDANGNKEYDQRFGGSGDEEFRYIQQTKDGGLLLGGRSDSDVSGDRTQTSQGSTDYWLVKVAPVSLTPNSRIEVTATVVKLVQVSLYPNPAHEKIRVNLSEPVQQLNTSITDLTGAVHGTNTHRQVADTTLEIPVTALKPAVYLLHIRTERGQHTLKFIKE